MYTILNPLFTVAKSFHFIILNCFSQLLFFILTHYMAYASCFPWQLKLRSGPYLAKAGGTDMSGAGTALKYLKMFVFPLDCCLWGSPELICAAAVRGGLTRQTRAWVYEMICAVGWGGVAYPFHLTESRAQCPSPAARHTLFPLPLYCFEPRRWSWLHKSGGNATRPVNHASCQAPPPQPNLYAYCAHPHAHTNTLSGSGDDVALPLSVCRKDDKDYALKQIEGTGISMSACREIAVRGPALLAFVWSLLNAVAPSSKLVYVMSHSPSLSSSCWVSKGGASDKQDASQMTH